MPVRRLPFFIALLLLVLAGTPARGQDTVLEAINLKHRSVEQVLPFLEPLVHGEGSVSGMHNVLLVRTTPANLAEIRRALEAIDTPPRRLRITVRQDVDRDTQQLQVLDGTPAFIAIGRPRPAIERVWVQTPYGGRVVESIAYPNLTTGFYVVPWVSGDRVTLEVSPGRDEPAPGTSMGSRQAHTKVSGHFGEWIDIGVEERSIQLRVEEAE